MEINVLKIARDQDVDTALVIVAVRATSAIHHEGAFRDAAARISEAVGLAKAIDLAVIETILVRLARLNAAAFLGKGKVRELGV